MYESTCIHAVFLCMQQSGLSGSQADGASAVSANETGYQTDFKRGRRFKRLMKMLSRCVHCRDIEGSGMYCMVQV